MLAKENSEQTQLALGFSPQRRVFRVSELNMALQRLFEDEFRGIFVTGEISGCRVPGSGHFYFNLKDESSQLKCVLFKGSARYIRFKPQDGLAVIARGNLEIYQDRGEYQLIVESLEPQGAGALQLAFEQLKRKLAAEGLFEASRKRPLPALARRIGIVTSPTGAVVRDMLHVLARRFPGIHVRVFPAQVQGEGAVDQVCAGIDYFSRSAWAQVVIVARGGGSLEDLWTFNEEAVARVVAACAVPVISAIGHETDFTICDFVADHRAPTPSAAAEIVICTRLSLIEQIEACRSKLLQGIRYRLIRSSRDLTQKGTGRAEALMQRALARRAQRLDDVDYRLQHLRRQLVEVRRRALTLLAHRLQATDLRLHLSRLRHRHEMLSQRLSRAAELALLAARRRHESAHLHLSQISPLAVLARGYAIVQDDGGRALRSAAETHSGDQLRVRLHKGQLTAIVSAIHDGNMEA